MNKYLITVILVFAGTMGLFAQSYAVTVKGGPGFILQKWSNTSRSPLLGYHGRIGIESAEDDENYNLYAELGYHQRGSALRNARYTDINTNQLVDLATQKYLFHNAALSLGAKSKRRISDRTLGFYGLAIRGEYTFATNLEEYRSIVEDHYNGAPVYPIKEFVKEWIYGVDVTGGLEYQMSEYVNGIVELRVSPDFAPQYMQPPISNVIGGQQGNISISERRVFNVSFELSVGLRFLRKIEYID